MVVLPWRSYFTRLVEILFHGIGTHGSGKCKKRFCSTGFNTVCVLPLQVFSKTNGSLPVPSTWLPSNNHLLLQMARMWCRVTLLMVNHPDPLPHLGTCKSFASWGYVCESARCGWFCCLKPSIVLACMVPVYNTPQQHAGCKVFSHEAVYLKLNIAEIKSSG